MQEMQVRSLDQKDPLEKQMVTCPSILAWENPWTEEPGGLQWIKSQRAGHDFTTEPRQYRADFVYPFLCRWAFGLLPLFGCFDDCCHEHGCTRTCLNTCFQCFSVCIQEWNC
ncbi:unnamed protein product [Rangifer tarandus platyrhynchus]|uniref:Uncharacterized protein n=1 Tax=Rangifer tarandus platyrhynchus TaxID=3082113 RepID=A0ABN8YE04_RANTA|nr:unnamed protein product [Rangifer tarandus platyrhynchus]